MSERTTRTGWRPDLGGLLQDTFVIGGLVLTGVGFWRVDPALGLIVPGLIMVGIGVGAARRGGEKP